MPESEDEKQNVQQLCTRETFLFYLGVEMERSRRYNRPFTLVLIQPPPSENHLAQAAAGQVLGLLRTCDVVAVFDNSAFVVALLPEAGADGARAVFDRFDEQLLQPGVDWLLKLAAYPENGLKVEYFHERFTELLSSTEGDGRLCHATVNASDNWRDLRNPNRVRPADLLFLKR